MISRRIAILVFCPTLYALVSPRAGAAPQVWSSGPGDITFVHAANSATADVITPDVSITRNGSQGIFNSDAESSYAHDTSPALTSWAFSGIDGNSLFTYGSGAADYANLTFDVWERSLDGGGALQSNIANRAAVLHLIPDDIYIDIEFTNWGGSGAGGAFTYIRAVGGAPAPGDATGDGLVNMDDYLAIDFGYLHGLSGFANGDFNGDGTIDAADYAIIDAAFSPGASSAALPSSVPEPASLWMVVLGVSLSGRWWRCRGRSISGRRGRG